MTPSLQLEATATATLTRQANGSSVGPWEIHYALCFDLETTWAEITSMKVRRLDYTLLDPADQVYRTWSDAARIGKTIGQIIWGGCMDAVDLDASRPVPPRFRTTLEYGNDGPAAPSVQTFTGAVTSQVPPLPFIESVTLTDDIEGAQNILWERRPITFTVTQVDGGTPPFLYQFKINGFVMRDWDPDPVFVWQDLILNGSPAVSGGYTAVVNVRRSTWSASEALGRVTFTLLF